MLIQHQTFFISVGVSVDFELLVEYRISIMNNCVMIGTNYHDVICVVIHAPGEVIDVMSMDDGRTVFFTDELTADLTAVTVYQF